MPSCYPSLLLLALLSLGSAGCDDSGRRPIQARVPVVEPLEATSSYPPVSAPPARQGSTQNHTQAPVLLAPLPLWSRDRQVPASLLSAIPDGRSVLIAKVEEKFASG